jgi:hypothetical protein
MNVNLILCSNSNGLVQLKRSGNSKTEHTITQHNTARCSFGPPLDPSNIDFSKPASSNKSDQPANAT